LKAIAKTTLSMIIILVIIIAAIGVYYVYTMQKPPTVQYPTKPITIYVPWSAGGGTDRTTREIATILQQKWGVQINVLNKVGGGGAATFYAGATVTPDGYTWTAITIELSIYPHLGTSNVSYQDFKPIAMLICNPAVVVVKSDAPWNTIQDLMNYIKQNPGKLKASGTAMAGVWDIARIGLLKAFNLSSNALPWVPSTGAAPALQELLSGGIQVAIVGSGEAKPFVDAGQVKILTVMADSRIQGLENVPTLKELGINWSICGWAGLAVPKDTPDDVVSIIVNAVKEAYNSRDFQTFLKNNSFVGKLMLGQDFKNYLTQEYNTFRPLLKEAGYI